MASYLATVDVGQFDLDTYREDVIRYLDAVDPDLDVPVLPTTGERFAISQAADSAYKRLSRTVTVPAAGGTLSFVANRQVEQGWDFFLVEAHEVGDGAWTTLADESGHTSQDTGNDCAGLAAQHPFLAEHYLTVDPDAGTCDTTGPTGEWNAASGVAFGPEEWTVDLSQFAGQTIELSLADVTDSSISLGGVTVDDVETSCGGGIDVLRERARRLDGAGSTRRAAPATRTTGWSAPRPTRPRPSVRSWTARWPVNRRSSTSSLGSSGVTRGATPARSSTTFRGSASPSRPRPGRSTPSTSSPTPSPGTPWSCTSSPISGTATASRCAGGATSGSTRVSRPTPSGCGPRRRDSGPRRRRSTSSTTTSSRWTTPGGRSPSATPGPTSSSSSRSTSGGP